MKDVHNVHSGCPNRHHCEKDESNCCYLLSTNNCYLNTERSENYL